MDIRKPTSTWFFVRTHRTLSVYERYKSNATRTTDLIDSAVALSTTSSAVSRPTCSPPLLSSRSLFLRSLTVSKSVPSPPRRTLSSAFPNALPGAAAKPSSVRSYSTLTGAGSMKRRTARTVTPVTLGTRQFALILSLARRTALSTVRTTLVRLDFAVRGGYIRLFVPEQAPMVLRPAATPSASSL